MIGLQRNVTATKELFGSLLQEPENLTLMIPEPTKYFLCEDLDFCSKNLLSTFKTQRCDYGKFFTEEVPLKSDSFFEGFAKDRATFIITDGLIVMPNSMDTRLTTFGLLQNCGVAVNVTYQKVLFLSCLKKKSYLIFT